jgi:hypothetical protein
VDHPQDDLETELVDLTTISMSTLRSCDPHLLAASTAHILAQVMRPRSNFGTSPPGRVD